MKKALLFTLVLLLGFELVTRFVLFPASEDFVRFAGYDAKAAALMRAHALRVAIVGNSAAEEGIDGPRLEAMLTQSLGRPVRIEMFLADGSEIVTWHAMLQRYFWSTHARADVYLLNYFGTLADRPQFEYLRVGMFFASPSQWPYYLRRQLQTLSQRVEFVLSSVCAMYGARDRIRDRALRTIVPGYEAFLWRLHYAPERGSTQVAQAEPPKFDSLERILAAAQSQRARVFVMAFPLRSSHYELDAQVLALARRGKLSVLDMRSTPGLTPASYRDSIHLIRSGRSVYTEHLGVGLARLLGAHAE